MHTASHVIDITNIKNDEYIKKKKYIARSKIVTGENHGRWYNNQEKETFKTLPTREPYN